MRFLDQRERPASWKRPLGDHDDAEMRAPSIALAQPLGDDADVEGNLRDQDGVGAARDARVERNPSGVAAHHFDDHDALVRFGGRVQAIDRVGREVDGRVEPEAVRGADDVVVDRLWHADDGDAALAELVCDREGAVAADHDQRVEPDLVKHLADAIRVVVRAVRRRHQLMKRIAAIDGAEDGAAEPQDARHVARRQHARAIRLEEAVEAVFEADALDAAVGRGLDDGADDGVQAGRVAAAGEDADALIADIRSSVSRKAGAAALRRLKPAMATSAFASWAASSVGRAPRSQCGGREFEPRAVHPMRRLLRPRHSLISFLP